MDNTITQDATFAAVTAVNHMSAWSLFLQADIIVKSVIIGLLLASLWSWAIIFDKVFRLRSLFRQAEDFEEKFWSGSSLEDLYERIGAKPREPKRSAGKPGAVSNASTLGERLDRVMKISLEREMDILQRRMIFLASTGSVAPFLGLFGTVWGIMNTFTAIGATSDTSLATVAPGIAEALFATAIGLVAAIPAVIAYNKLSSDLGRYAGRLENFAGEFGAILSRQLDVRGS